MNSLSNLREQLTRPPSDEKIAMYQKWRDLLFLHWEYDPAELQKKLPPGLKIDTFQDKAYIGIVPFRMEGIRPPFAPAIPGISNILELNMRTYAIDQEGYPVVWFFSLDANKKLAVKIARTFFHLNYFWARQKFENRLDGYFFNSTRIDSGKSLKNEYLFKPDGTLFFAQSESLEFFLTARFILFSFDQKKRRLYRGRIFHKPYPLTKVNLLQYNEFLLQENGFSPLNRFPDHVIMSPGVNVNIYYLKKINYAE